MRRTYFLVIVAALTVAADRPGRPQVEPAPYLRMELEGDQAKVEIRGRLFHLISSFRPTVTSVEVGPVSSFLLVSRDDEFSKEVLRLHNRTVVVRGTMSLAATQERRYVQGSFLGRRRVVQVTSLKAAGEETR